LARALSLVDRRHVGICLVSKWEITHDFNYKVSSSTSTSPTLSSKDKKLPVGFRLSHTWRTRSKT